MASHITVNTSWAVAIVLMNKGKSILFVILTGIFIENRWLRFCHCCCYCWWAQCDAVQGQCPSIRFAHPFGNLFESENMRKFTSIICANLVFIGSFHTDDRFFFTHRYFWWVGRSFRFILEFKIRHSFTDENNLIFMGIVTICIMQVAACGMGIPKIVTSFIGSSWSSARSATILITCVGIIFLFLSKPLLLVAAAAGNRVVYNWGTLWKLKIFCWMTALCRSCRKNSIRWNASCRSEFPSYIMGPSSKFYSSTSGSPAASANFARICCTLTRIANPMCFCLLNLCCQLRPAVETSFWITCSRNSTILGWFAWQDDRPGFQPARFVMKANSDAKVLVVS